MPRREWPTPQRAGKLYWGRTAASDPHRLNSFWLWLGGHRLGPNPVGYAAHRRPSTLRRQSTIWFQLAKVRFTKLPSALSDDAKYLKKRCAPKRILQNLRSPGDVMELLSTAAERVAWNPARAASRIAHVVHSSLLSRSGLRNALV